MESQTSPSDRLEPSEPPPELSEARLKQIREHFAWTNANILRHVIGWVAAIGFTVFVNRMGNAPAGNFEDEVQFVAGMSLMGGFLAMYFAHMKSGLADVRLTASRVGVALVFTVVGVAWALVQGRTTYGISAHTPQQATGRIVLHQLWWHIVDAVPVVNVQSAANWKLELQPLSGAVRRQRGRTRRFYLGVFNTVSAAARRFLPKVLTVDEAKLESLRQWRRRTKTK